MASQYKVAFTPLYKAVTVPAGMTLLEAAGKAGIAIDSVCGGDGICGRCRMIVVEGKVGGDATALLTREEIRQGVVLACQTTVESDLRVEIPAETVSPRTCGPPSSSTRTPGASGPSTRRSGRGSSRSRPS